MHCQSLRSGAKCLIGDDHVLVDGGRTRDRAACENTNALTLNIRDRSSGGAGRGRFSVTGNVEVHDADLAVHGAANSIRTHVLCCCCLTTDGVVSDVNRRAVRTQRRGSVVAGVTASTKECNAFAAWEIGDGVTADVTRGQMRSGRSRALLQYQNTGAQRHCRTRGTGQRVVRNHEITDRAGAVFDLDAVTPRVGQRVLT